MKARLGGTIWSVMGLTGYWKIGTSEPTRRGIEARRLGTMTGATEATWMAGKVKLGLSRVKCLQHWLRSHKSGERLLGFKGEEMSTEISKSG